MLWKSELRPSVTNRLGLKFLLLLLCPPTERKISRNIIIKGISTVKLLRVRLLLLGRGALRGLIPLARLHLAHILPIIVPQVLAN